MLWASSRITTAPWISIPCIWRVCAAEQTLIPQEQPRFQAPPLQNANMHNFNVRVLKWRSVVNTLVQWGGSMQFVHQSLQAEYDEGYTHYFYPTEQATIGGVIFVLHFNTPWYPGCSCRAWRSHQRQTSTHEPGSRDTFYTLQVNTAL